MLLSSTYKRPFWLFHPHLETIIPSMFHKVADLTYTRTQINTPDGDFLDADWVNNNPNAKKIVIISHGLEGSTDRGYMKGMAKRFVAENWHALAWNHRSCGGNMNRLPRFYHSGATEDLKCVVDYVVSLQKYDEIALVGFSLGGNVILKYLGEEGNNLPKILKKASVFSVPLHLSSCSKKLNLSSNWVYKQLFRRELKAKILAKSKIMPHDINPVHLPKIVSLKDFDNYYTAPLHGFADAEDYYEKCSSLYFLDNIQIPTLIVNALNDPFLAPDCFPKEKLEKHPFVFFETPYTGGHCGFSQKDKNGFYWSENRAFEWNGK
jgi:uncharacterized protein